MIWTKGVVVENIEQEQGRLPEDKVQGIVKLDIDLLVYDDDVLKPKDLEREFVKIGLEELEKNPPYKGCSGISLSV